MSVTHILHVTYDMNIGGTEQVIRNLVEGLDKTRFKSSILCIDGTIGPWGQSLQEKGYTHYCLKRQPGFDRALIRDIRNILREADIDIVHCHQYTPYTYGWFASLFTGKPVIFTEHGRFYPDVSSTKRRLINPLLQLRTAAITAISAATKQALVQFENLSADRIEVIYNGIADSVTAPSAALKDSLGIADGEVVLGTISRLDPIKNQAMMLKAFKRAIAQAPNLRLLIVGDGPLRAELEYLTRDLGISDRVIYTGFQPEPKKYLAIMDVFLLPSLSEGTSMTLLEAMSFGIPSIATAVGGTPEIIQNQETGLLIENEDESGLVEAIIELAGSEERRKKYGSNARRQYETRFTLESMTAQYEKLYHRIHKPRPR